MIYRKPKYSKFEDRGRFIGSVTEIRTNISAVAEKVKKIIVHNYPADLCFGAIITSREIPDAVVKAVNELFGVGFSKKEDAYAVVLDEDIKIFSKSARGLIYGALSVLGMAEEQYMPRGIYYEAPAVNVRGAKVYLPGRDGIGFFKEFINFLAAFRMNTLMIEIGGAMEYKSHPEINEGWVEYCREMREYSGKSHHIQSNIYGWKKNSIHSENGDGGFLTKDEVKNIADYCRERHIDIIPEVPSLSHCDYLLTRHPELRERQNDDYADTYCPSNEGSYKLLFDILDEIVEVFEPKDINIGHDEFYTFGKCEKCRVKDPVDIFVEDIVRINDYLKKKGVRSIIWSEKLLDARLPDGMPCGGANVKVDYDGKESIEEIAAIYPSADRLPTDVGLFHWYWGLSEDYDDVYHKRGFSVTYGNFSPTMFKNWKGRINRGIGIEGGIISNWSSAKKENLQRNGVYYGLAYANLMFWEDDYTPALAPEFERLSFEMLYAYNYAGVSHGIKILHTTAHDMDYKVFHDGNFIVHEEYDMGFYKITFADGSESKIPVEYGMNISSKHNEWVMAQRKLPEIALTALPVRIKDGCGNITAYEFIFETDPKPVKSVEYMPNPSMDAKAEILRFEVF